MKIFIIFCMVVVCQVSCTDLQYGSCHRAELQYNRDIKDDFTFMKTIEEIHSYCTCDPRQVIKCVTVEDNWTDGTNGMASIISGGPDYNCVTVKFQSQFGRGYNFNLKVYVKP
ncbi:unnamed protein product [Brassicogethes aeneus]|uniref:Venom protein n=1 Tax=Brassicogethes aeneus TaxID=1431903 RepID=A0A9P0B5S7_BRAAE|nr:unnamed protein product [Brassicogethes aeneus]